MTGGAWGGCHLKGPPPVPPGGTLSIPSLRAPEPHSCRSIVEDRTKPRPRPQQACEGVSGRGTGRPVGFYLLRMLGFSILSSGSPSALDRSSRKHRDPIGRSPLWSDEVVHAGVREARQRWPLSDTGPEDTVCWMEHGSLKGLHPEVTARGRLLRGATVSAVQESGGSPEPAEGLWESVEPWALSPDNLSCWVWAGVGEWGLRIGYMGLAPVKAHTTQRSQHPCAAPCGWCGVRPCARQAGAGCQPGWLAGRGHWDIWRGCVLPSPEGEPRGFLRGGCGNRGDQGREASWRRGSPVDSRWPSCVNPMDAGSGREPSRQRERLGPAGRSVHRAPYPGWRVGRTSDVTLGTFNLVTGRDPLRQL